MTLQAVTPIVLGFFGLLKGVMWPLIVLTAALTYRQQAAFLIPQIFSWLMRTRRLEAMGLKIEIDAAEGQKAADQANIVVDKASIVLKEIPGLTRTEAIGNLERDFFERLQHITGAEPIDVLVRNLAQARLEARLGYIYAGIFGSQISGLIGLEARRRISTDEAYAFYQTIEGQFPDVYAGYGFAGWLGFVRNNGLVDLVGSDVVITPFGEDFLQWLKATQLSINKPY